MATLNRNLSFRWLLAPMTPAEFFERHHRRSPVHVPGGADKAAALFSWQAMNRLLEKSSTWTAAKIRLVKDRVVLPESEYARPAVDRALGRIMRPVPQAIGAKLEEGATININEVEWLDSGLASVSCSLAMVFAAHARCNLYASRGGIAAFPSHFDNTDVYVLHVEGEKRWRIYERPFPGATDSPGFNSASFPPEYHEQHKGGVLLDLTLTPGDMLYIPRGYYHDALASSAATLHLTFGIDEVLGLSVMEALQGTLAGDPLLREPLPDPDDAGAHREHVARIAARVADLITAPDFGTNVRALQKNHAFWDLPGFSLPAAQFDQIFRLRRQDARIEGDAAGCRLCIGNRALALSEAHEPLVRWMLDGDYFDTDALVAHFSDVDEATLHRALETLVEAGLIETIADFV